MLLYVREHTTCHLPACTVETVTQSAVTQARYCVVHLECVVETRCQAMDKVSIHSGDCPLIRLPGKTQSTATAGRISPIGFNLNSIPVYVDILILQHLIGCYLQKAIASFWDFIPTSPTVTA